MAKKRTPEVPGGQEQPGTVEREGRIYDGVSGELLGVAAGNDYKDEAESKGEGIETIEDVGDIAEPPTKGVKAEIRELLLSAMNEDDLAEAPYNYNPKTIRVVAWELEKEGLRQRVMKKDRGGQQRAKRAPSAGRAAAHSEGELPLVTTTPTSRPASPEAIIANLDLAINGSKGEFEAGMKAGMSVVVLGVRIAQELSNVGVQQSRPLLAMAREMRQGEESAAKSAAKDAAENVADQITSYFQPALVDLADRVDKNKPKIVQAASADPMQDMMVRTMEPLLKNMMSKFMPGMNIPAGEGSAEAPAGWEIEEG